MNLAALIDAIADEIGAPTELVGARE